jgi:hypothetical protein
VHSKAILVPALRFAPRPDQFASETQTHTECPFHIFSGPQISFSTLRHSNRFFLNVDSRHIANCSMCFTLSPPVVPELDAIDVSSESRQHHAHMTIYASIELRFKNQCFYEWGFHLMLIYWFTS